MSIAADVPLPLEYQPQPNPPARPKRTDEAICRAAAEACAHEVMIWLGENPLAPAGPDSRKTVVNQIAEAMQYTHGGDGYDIAAALDRRWGWTPDSRLVEILDSAHDYEALAVAVRKWVKNNNIAPKHGIGESVFWRSGKGEIVAVDEDTAEYIIQTQEWLAKNPTQVGKRGGLVVAFEAVEPT